ncbi:MAG: ABC transporter ATP-binding protein [Gemmatimonadota bacterium]|nr:ABC transporter ATP-binding protein [Gemmatimonadota bacterium]MDE2984980.1 ABC transporter ATP-binding protein [Gemmatimonadota bacterium]
MVHLTDVTKYYGSKRALGPVSFEIEKGNTVGFLGLNGVGKTTLLRILACGLRPSSGTALVDGFDVLRDPHAVRKRVGYLPELPPVYRDMTVTDYLTFAGRIKGMSPEAVARRMPEVQERTRIVEVRDIPTGHLSQGYRQRVGVAQAIIHEPELLILDEPTHDLDPVQIMEMRAMIRSLKDSHTILISSHILPEISRTCDRLLILNDGEIVASGTEEELGEKLFASRRLAVTVRLEAAKAGDGDRAAAVGAARAAIARVPGVTGVEIPDSPGSVDRDADAVSFQVEGDTDLRAEVCRALVESGHDVTTLNRAERGLERVFVGLVGKGGTWH